MVTTCTTYFNIIKLCILATESICVSCRFSQQTVIISQNYWFFGLFPSSGVLGSRNTTFQKLDLFPSSGEGRGEDTYSVWPLRKSCLLPPFTWGRKQIQFPKRHVSTPKNTWRWKKSKNPVILCDIHHHQNPLKSSVPCKVQTEFLYII
jgi:hypothetical protein